MIDELYLAPVIGRIDKKPVTSKQSSIEFVLVHFWKNFNEHLHQKISLPLKNSYNENNKPPY